MKNGKVWLVMVFVLLAGSCVSMQDRASRNNEVLETIQVTFTSYQPLQFIIPKEKIRKKAYSKLLEQAEQKYQGEIDIANINIKGTFSAWNLLTMLPAGFGFGYGGAVVSLGPDGDNGIGAAIGGPIIAIAGVFLTGNFQRITVTGDIIATGEYRVLSNRCEITVQGLNEE
jgi:hypothetical protein